MVLPLKYVSLILLVLQNTLATVFIRYSRVAGGDMYFASTAVLMAEVAKFLICPVIIFMECERDLKRFKEEISKHITFTEVLKLSVPSLIYNIQNNLLYFALSRLDAATFQASYQTKLLTTAVFSVIFLKRTLSWTQWLSLFVLAGGVALAQISPEAIEEGKTVNIESRLLGFGAVMTAAVLSGFAGVYFEMILKGSNTSLWIRNVQLSCSSVLLAAATIFVSGEHADVAEKGIFHGYTNVVVGVILIQALGGLLVAVVVKYADNILKGFAASVSIVTSCLLSLIIFPDFSFNRYLVAGIGLVSLATYMYSIGAPTAVSAPTPIKQLEIAQNDIESNKPLLAEKK